MNITYSRQAVKAISHINAPVKQRIKQGILGIPQGDIKRLQGHTEFYRLRIGDWRIVFSYLDAETVLIERIAPRGDVYKGV